MGAGISPGAALVFLIVGPDTNAATVTTLWKTLGSRTTLIYLATIAFCALAAGLLCDNLLRWVDWSGQLHIGHPQPGWIHYTTGVLLLTVLLATQNYQKKLKKEVMIPFSGVNRYARGRDGARPSSEWRATLRRGRKAIYADFSCNVGITVF